MSNYSQSEFCIRCGETTDHNWYDNTPRQHQYTVECLKCSLRTPDSEWWKSRPLEIEITKAKAKQSKSVEKEKK